MTHSYATKSPKSKIILAFTLSIFLILVTSFLAFRSVQKLKSNLNIILQPNELIHSLQGTQEKMAEVQSYIRAYSYSGNNKYLSKYYIANDSLTVQLNRLSVNITEDERGKFDTIQYHIGEKRKLIAKYINMQNSEQGQQELDSVLTKLTEYIELSRLGDSTPPAVRKDSGIMESILKFMFSGRRKSQSDIDSTIVLADNSLIEMRKNLHEAMARKEERIEFQTAIEMALLAQDIEIMEQLRLLISDLMNSAENSLDNEKARSAQYIESSIILLGAIIVISFLVIVLFLLRILRDIKSIDMHRSELAVASEYAEEQGRAKARFMSNMSHEIRTPLTAILGFSEQLKKNGATKKERDSYIDIITKSSEHLLHIVNEILTFSKLQSHKIDLELSEFNYKELLDEVNKVLSIKADEKKLELNFTTTWGKPDWFVGDAQKIKQVLINLISNALKFTDKGKVEVVSELLQEKHKQHARLLIHVKDTGIGIPEDKIEDVFREFSQNKITSSEKHGGTGLGLTISKEFVEMMDGQITVESEEQVGTTFHVELPLRVLTDQRNEEGAEEVQEEVSYRFEKSLNVLLVDDDEWNRMLGKITLDNMNINVDMANDGAEGLKLAIEKKYDLILMDIQMPNMDGTEATRQIRTHEHKNGNAEKVSIIALTADVVTDQLKTFTAAGMDGYLLKPFKEKELYEIIEGVLKRNGS